MGNSLFILWAPESRRCPNAVESTVTHGPENAIHRRLSTPELIRSALLGGQSLEQLPELLDRESGVTHKTAHREGIDRVVTRNGENSLAIRHHNMLALACNPETRLLKSTNCIQVVDASDFGQSLHRDFDFADLFATELFLDDN